MNLNKRKKPKTMPQGAPRKYLKYDQAKNYLSNFAFGTIKEYQTYIAENKIDFLPKNPAGTYYHDGFKAYDFLGIDEATHKANVKKNRVDICKMMKTRPRPSKYNMAKKEKPVTKSLPQIVTVVKEVPTGLDPDTVISFLIQEDVEPDTIVKMIAELNISSGTLMAELCKYMTKKTLEKQATWRPTGYTTAEAQMTSKI
jgi:hypothetical protein